MKLMMSSELAHLESVVNGSTAVKHPQYLTCLSSGMPGERKVKNVVESQLGHSCTKRSGCIGPLATSHSPRSENCITGAHRAYAQKVRFWNDSAHVNHTYVANSSKATAAL